jgi:hypothetical protein
MSSTGAVEQLPVPGRLLGLTVAVCGFSGVVASMSEVGRKFVVLMCI